MSKEALDCYLCGARAKTGYIGDDFCRNIKRAICSNPDCRQSRVVTLQGGPPVYYWHTPTIEQWDEMQEYPERIEVREL